jgi:hypothetical protein
MCISCLISQLSETHDKPSIVSWVYVFTVLRSLSDIRQQIFTSWVTEFSTTLWPGIVNIGANSLPQDGHSRVLQNGDKPAHRNTVPFTMNGNGNKGTLFTYSIPDLLKTEQVTRFKKLQLSRINCIMC